MNFEPNDDQRAFLDAVARFVERHAARPLAPVHFEYPEAAARELAQSGYFDAIAIEELGPVAAAALVIELARLPFSLETAASALLAPWLCPQWSGPFAVLAGDVGGPVRHLPIACTLLRVDDDGVEAARMQADAVESVESAFADPIGRLRSPRQLEWTRVAGADEVPRARILAQVGTAAEIVGSLAAALDAVLEHVRQRRQFGRPIGSFQAMQHRLAECASAIEAARWLTLRAAWSQHADDAALAAAHAQESTRRVVYDLHQFMGAMGLTLEHPLHRWTYRARLLASHGGGSDRQFVAAADAVWGTHAGVAP